MPMTTEWIRRQLDAASEDDVQTVLTKMGSALGFNSPPAKGSDLLEFFHRMVDLRLGHDEHHERSGS